MFFQPHGPPEAQFFLRPPAVKDIYLSPRIAGGVVYVTANEHKE